MDQTLGRTKRRKTRSDKKRDMRPTISTENYECLSRISYITNSPIKQVGETFCKLALITTPIIDSLSGFFLRDYWSTANVLYPGHYDNEKYPVVRKPGRIRVTIRLRQQDYDKIQRLAFSLSITPHATAAILLEKALQTPEIVDAFISHRVRRELDSRRMRELREVFKYINANQPVSRQITFTAFISAIYESVKNAGISAGNQLREKIIRWLDSDT